MTSVSLGDMHSAAITENGELYCWGHNWNGQVGNGSTTDQPKPVKILEHVTSALLGDWYSAAITENGELYGWGYNSYGQVGNGSTTNQLTPVKVLDHVSTGSSGKIPPYSPSTTESESNVVASKLETKIKAKLSSGLKDIKFADGKLKGPSLDIMDGKYTFTPLDVEFKAGLPLSKLKYQAVIDSQTKTVKVWLGVSKDGKCSITQTSKMTDASWSKQYNELKALYKDMTGFDAKGSNSKGVNNWNRFQKLKGQLNRMGCDMFINADLALTGYIEYDYSTGELNFKEGGIIEEASVGGSLKFPVYSTLVYTTLGLKLGEKGTLALEKTGESFVPSAAIDLYATATASIVGQLPLDIAKVEGGINATLTGTLATKKPTFTMKMSGNLFVEISALAGSKKIFNGQWPYADCTIYPEFKNNLEKSILRNYNSMDELMDDAVAVDRIHKYNSSVGTTTEWYGADLSKSVYLDNAAKLVTLKDGRKMLVWLDDMGEKDDNNMTSLMYSVYDGTSWSEAEAVAEDGCFFGEFSINTDEQGNVWLVYQKGNEVFPSDMEYKDMLRKIDLYMVKYDGEAFSAPIRVTQDNSAYESNMQVSVTSKEAVVSWVEYSSDYMAGTDTNLQICSRKYDISNNAFSDTSIVQSTSNHIAYLANMDQTIYALEKSEEDTTYSLYKIGESQTSVIDTFSQVTRLESDQENIYYLKDGELFRYDGENSISTQLSEITDFHIAYGNGSTVVLASEYYDDQSVILMSELTDGTGDGFETYAVYDQYVKNYTGAVDANGDLSLALGICDWNKDDCTYENMKLVTTGRKEYVSLAVGAVSYDYDDLKPGTALPVKFQISNSGNVTSEAVTAFLKDESGNVLAQKQLEDTIGGGAVKEFSINYNVPEDLCRHTVYLEILSDKDKDLSDNCSSTEIGLGDLSLKNVQMQSCSKGSRITGSIENIGFDTNENVQVELVQNTKSGENEVTQCAVGDICKAGESTFELLFANSQIEQDGNEYASFSLKVTSDDEEMHFDNNELKMFEKEEQFASGQEETHVPVTDAAVKATCTEDGKTEGAHCMICREVLMMQNAIPASGHKHTEVRNAREATYIKEGYTGDIYCLDCGNKISDGTVIPMLTPPSETPSPSAAPSVSETPSTSAAPSVSETPSPSAAPSVSETPSPSASAKPVISSAPSTIPGASTKPTPSASPSPSAAPSASETPSPSAAPSVSETPSPSASAKPVISSAPSASTKPSASPSSRPSEQPSEIPSISPSEFPNEDIVKGDVNGDNQVTLTDAQIVLKVALGITSLTDESVADVNGDKQVSLIDAQLVLKAALGIIKL